MIEKLILFFELIFGLHVFFLRMLNDIFVRILKGEMHLINNCEDILQRMMLILCERMLKMIDLFAEGFIDLS